MAEDASQLIRLRNDFYRDNYYRVMWALLLMIVVNIFLLGIIYYQLTHKPDPQYFAVSPDGKIIKLEALSVPVYGQDFINQWATQAAISIHSYDFVHYREALTKAQSKFTAEGWRNFEDALKEARSLEMVKVKHLVVSAIPTGAPVVLEKGVIEGRYMWKIQLPMEITYDSGTSQLQQPVLATIQISRVPIENFPEGIAINMYVESIEQPETTQ